MELDLNNVFPEEFYSRSTLQVAPDLLGTVLCRRLPEGVICAEIVEVEAYTEDDPACHASRGITKRCEVMFGAAGRSYVYFIYGMYNCFNVVTETHGKPGAVLIRAVGIKGGEGPGKLCKTLKIDRTLNAVNLMDPEGPLWIVEGRKIPKREIGKSIRVGISVAQEKQWRYFIKEHPHISVKNVKPHKPKSRSGKGIIK